MTTWTTSLSIPNPSNAWTDTVISANVTTVKKRHIDEIRAFLEGENNHYHIVDGVITTGNPSISVAWGETITATTTIKPSHITELRAVLTSINNHGHTAKGLSTTTLPIDVSFPSGGITATSTLIRKPHMDELRAACETLHSHVHTLCCECECQCQCTCTCTCTCQENCCSQCWACD
jgi:hypothetical protein